MTSEQAVEEVAWEVKQVLDKKINPVTGNVEYLLQWKNWEGSPTWEPEDNCECTFLIRKFEKELKARESSNLSSQTPNKQQSQPSNSRAHGSRSTVKRRRNVLRSSSSSSPGGNRASSQPPSRSQPTNSQALAVRRSERVKEVSDRNIVDLTIDTTSTSSGSSKSSSSGTDTDKGDDDNEAIQVVEDKPAIEWFDTDGPRAKSPPPQQACDSSCSDIDNDKIKERKLRLKEIVGAINGEPVQLIVKWHGVRDLERVPLKILRNFYCQEILDFLIKKIKWT